MSYRVAIVGAGIGSQHLDAFQLLPAHFQVCCICDLDLSRARALSQRQPDCQALTNVADIIARRDIDIIDICLPPALHAKIAIDALTAGKHVICEKPMATSVVAGHAMAQAALQHRRILTPVFQYRYGHSFDQLQALIDAGLAGKPLVATLETHWSRTADYYNNPWRGSWAGERGGAVVTHAIHSHDLISRFFGPVSRVSALLDTRANPIETDDCAALSMQTQSGALVTSSVTLGAADDSSRLRLVFAGLTAESGREPYAPGQVAWQFNARAPTRQQQIGRCIADCGSPDPAGQGYAGQFLELAAALDGRANALVTAQQGIESLELIAAIYASARSGSRIELPLDASLPEYRDWTGGRAEP